MGEEPGLHNCFNISGWIKITESVLVFICLMLHRIGDDGKQVWFAATDLDLNRQDTTYEAEVDTEIIGGAVMAFTIISPLLLLAYAIEGTNVIQRTSMDVLFSITGAFLLVALGGMTCFAWHNANENNSSVARNQFVAAGVLGVMCILTGVLYLVDFFWMIYRKAVISDVVEPMGYY